MKKALLRQLSDRLSCFSPVIVAGCSRSGTSLVAALLRDCGCAMGADRSGNLETRLFQRINVELLDYLGASWRCTDVLPSPERLAGGYKYLAAHAVKQLADHVETCGDRPEIPGDPNAVWGWKDPRNCLTLPVWLQVFPQARVLHVVRNGLDVAESLKRREDSRHSDPEYQTGEEADRLRRLDVTVWAEYIDRTVKAMTRCERTSVIRFEQLLVDPVVCLDRSLSELGLPVPQELSSIAGRVDRDRFNERGPLFPPDEALSMHVSKVLAGI